MTRALVSAVPGEWRTALLDDDGHLLDLLVERADRPALVGNRYLGRVSAVDAGLAAAFVEIGLERPALLPLKGAPRVSEGDTVAVEITRAPGRAKGAKLRAVDAPAEGTPPRLLAAADHLAGLLRRHAPDSVRVEGDGALAGLKRRLPDLAGALQGHTGKSALFDSEGLEAEIEALLEPEVPLPGGGRLVIEPVTALTAIDVDAGGRDARGGAGRLALELDCAAAREIGRQLRLRALSGLIVVDFLELTAKADRQAVAEALTEALAGDPVATDVGPVRASGLMEIARRRERPPLHELLTEPCGIGGGGRVKDAATLAFEALRAARREGLARPGAGLAVVAAPAVAEALESGAAAPARAALERRLGAPLALRRDPARPREAVEIVLGSQ